jgi:predicted metalloprotease with PDZ domain
MRHFAALRDVVLTLVAIVALLVPTHALAQALERAEAQLADPAATGPELVGRPTASAPARESGYLGIKADDRNVEAGVRIAEVIKHGPAEAAGLQVGDLITAVHGKAVRTVDEFAVQLAGMSVGTHVVFDIERVGQPQSIEVVLGTKQSVAAVPQVRLGPLSPRDEALGASPISTGTRAADRPAPLGLRVEMIDEAARRARGLPNGAGVLVTRVTNNSAAGKTGIVVGAVVLAIDGQNVATPDDAATIIGRARVGQPLAFTLSEGGQQVVRNMMPEASGQAAPAPRTTKRVSSPVADETPAAAPGRRTKRPMDTINSEINDARSTIRRLQQRVVELEHELEALQDKAEKRRDDILETEEAIRQAAPKSKASADSVEP